MKREWLSFVLLNFLLLWLVACGEATADTPAEAGATGAVAATAESAATPSAAAATATEPVEIQASVTPTAAEPSATAAPDSALTATLPPIRATQQALMDQVRVPTRDATAAPQIAPDDYVALTQQACRIVQENYVRDNFNGVDWPDTCARYEQQAAAISDQEAFWDLMDAFIGELDDNHSRFVRPGSFAAEFGLPSQQPGRAWPGLRINPAREDQQLLLWDVCDVGPAAQAGLERGDVVLAIDGQPAESFRGEQGFDYGAIVEALYGGDKNEVTLTVQQGPGAAPREVTLEYGGAGGCEGWRYGLLSEQPRIGYIRIADFGGDSDTNVLQMIESLEADAPLDGLVLDVRHNPGGNSDSDIAIFTQGTFGKVGPLREDATQTIWRIRGPVRWNETTPLVLLTDGASHSAAEYFATAMQQSGRATLVGMPTAGNTEGITGFNLADGSVIRLAVQTLQLEDGTTLEGTGVIPDVQVPLGEWGLRQMPDVQLQAAYDTLLETQ